ncbi:MAG: glycoside hydrolase family 99-like domain-containing protein [Planctomycetota bacterium]
MRSRHLAAVAFLLTVNASAADAPGTPALPFIREMKVGYLLNYSFLSPRPYCWTGNDCLLSGWEVDRSGGSFTFSPNCRYPAGFAFHSDWFKLLDNSATAAVTIKHQLARQSAGQITLELRFKMPAKMDGVCWQLRDLQEPAVSLLTDGGNLCFENAAGQPQVLQPYEADHDYGVKVVADISARIADIYIDGALKARAAPFCRAVKTIDYVLVKTGDAATGELFLGPVNVYKGYAVNETFVTCAPGKVPADWKIEQGAVAVETFECCTKPDIFSLKLARRALEAGMASKTFPALKGKTVFECRFLVPVKCNGTVIALNNGLTLLVTDKEIIARTTETLQLVSDYRANLWYTLKLAIDTSGGVDIWINGKPVAQKAFLEERLQPFDTIRFSSVSTLWIDDVRVYPWQDYPVDYVPEPQPCPAKAPYLLGVQSCNLWQEGSSYAGWDYVYPFRAQRKPYLGWYDEGNPEETDWEIKWQVEHGIGFEMHCWYRPNNAINHPIKEGVLDQGIVKGLFNARYSGLAKFAIMCTDEGACETNLQDWRENIIPYWIEYFFKDPRYFKLEGKPVLSIYHLGHFQRMLGGAEGCRKAIAVLREEVAQAGLPGIIVLMENRSSDRNVFKTMKSIGVDACFWRTAEHFDGLEPRGLGRARWRFHARRSV